jgi:hypothetical protein
MVVTNAINETFNLATMTGWEVKRLARELRAEVTIYQHNLTKRNFLQDQLDEVDAEIRRKMY